MINIDKKNPLAKILLVFIGFMLTAVIYKAVMRKNKPQTAHTAYWGSIKNANTKVQTTPDYNSATKAVVNKMGVPIYITECNKQWCNVRFINDLTGWVNRGSITKKSTSMVKELTSLYKDKNLKRKIATIYPFVVVENYEKVGEVCRVGKGAIRGWLRCKSLVGGYTSPDNK